MAGRGGLRQQKRRTVEHKTGRRFFLQSINRTLVIFGRKLCISFFFKVIPKRVLRLLRRYLRDLIIKKKSYQDLYTFVFKYWELHQSTPVVRMLSVPTADSVVTEKSVPHFTAPYTTVPHPIELYRTAPYTTKPYRTVLHPTVPYLTAPYTTVPY